MVQWLAAAAIAACAAIPAAAVAQTWPAKPVRIVVPYPPGGAADILARALAQKLGESLGRPLVVDNRPGGAGAVGTEHVARSEPDGHTLLLAATGHVVNASLQARIPYDPVRDFLPVSQLSELHSVLVVHPVLPARDVGTFLVLARRHPGKLNYASGGNGTSQHLSGELFRSMAKIDIVHVPYKGGAPALNDLLGGHVEVMFATLPSALGYVRSGRLRALGTTGTKRSQAAQDIPTIAEQGLAAYESVGWQGLLLPSRAPREIAARLNTEVRAAMETPEMRSRLLAIGFDTVTGPAERFGALIAAELAKWAAVIKASGARAD